MNMEKKYVIHADILENNYLSNTNLSNNMSEKYAFELFKIESKSWEYEKSICLNIKNGKPYYLDAQYRNRGAAYYFNNDYSLITYDELKEYAKQCGCYARYKDLDESNWKNFIPADMLSADDAKKKIIQLNELDSIDTFEVDEFYFAQNANRASYITYLRKCDSGYRVFFAQNESYFWPAKFFKSFTKTEEEIKEILENKFYPEYSAFDRLLSDKELQYVAYMFNHYRQFQKGYLDNSYKSFKTVNGNEFVCKSDGYYFIQNVLEQIARYGSNFSRDY